MWLWPAKIATVNCALEPQGNRLLNCKLRFDSNSVIRSWSLGLMILPIALCTVPGMMTLCSKALCRRLRGSAARLITLILHHTLITLRIVSPSSEDWLAHIFGWRNHQILLLRTEILIEETCITNFCCFRWLPNSGEVWSALEEVHCICRRHLVQMKCIRLITAKVERHLFWIWSVLLRTSEFLRKLSLSSKSRIFTTLLHV